MRSKYLIRAEITAPAQRAVKLALGSGAFPHTVVIPAGEADTVYFTRPTRKHIEILKVAAQQGCTITVRLPFGQSSS